MKCFCGKEAKYLVTVINEGDNKFLKHPRCVDCKDRALSSYKTVKVELLEN